MKKIIFTCALFTFVSIISFAQSKQTGNAAHPNTAAATPPPPPPPAPPGQLTPQQMAEQRAKAIQQQYKLSPEQYKGAYKVETDFFTQERQLRTSGAPIGQGQIMQMMMGRDQKYKEIMTPEQWAKYDETRPKMTPPASQPAH